ncbi:energy transducer TonB [Veronia pacifica]|uniref:Protein TonB n=1 Tax=Veronia pacifica TaxID=1080227 RepID=A0A1C3EE60_9GAMM|nr:energy transducer TonB [Veronia pacifica]ODA31542.1 hypothetical protein A8L45_16725 [Veronia pacifica]
MILRWLLSISASFFIVLILLVIMASLVHHKDYLPQTSNTKLTLDFFVTEPDSQTIRKVRQSLSTKPPIPPDQPAGFGKPEAIEAPISANLPLLTPTLSDRDAITIPGVSQQGMELGEIDIDDNMFLQHAESRPDFSPSLRIEPSYPLHARMRGIEGFVVLALSVDENGKPYNVEVKEANPRRVFEREAIRAVRQWRYPATGAQTTLTVRLEFTLSQQEGM